MDRWPRRCAVVFGIMICAIVVQAQTALEQTISGTVVDDSTGAPLENVNVFVVRTTLGTNTDTHGLFRITALPLGSSELIVSRVGYEVMSYRIPSHPTVTPIVLRLRAVPISVEEVVVSATEAVQWRDQYAKFRRLFFGISPNAEECRITNPEVIDFSEAEDIFVASAGAPLEIENEALGYHIRFLMTLFRVEDVKRPFMKGMGTTYDGSPMYTRSGTGNAATAEKWKRNRLTAYRGSLRHFLASLVNGNWEEEGFKVTLMPYFNMPRSSPDRTAITPETAGLILSDAVVDECRTLEYEGFLEVVYAGERFNPSFERVKMMGRALQTSWLQLNHRSITVSRGGLVKEQFPTTIYGAWVWERFADALPLDYSPED